MNPAVQAVTDRIARNSGPTRAAYLARIRAARAEGPHRAALGCGNLAHGFAACGAVDKARLAGVTAPNVAIVTAYNDLLSAHQPFADYPRRITRALAEIGAVGQVAGGVPAMCDGITQGRPGMELSLFSRDVVALSTAIALSHDLFDGVLCLGVCDKIVPGLLMGALSFGHLPAVFVPAGPMPTGVANAEKAKVREAYAAGRATRAELLEVESNSYHAPGTCTFYGTANSNQVLMEVMGLQLPGASFVPPGTPERDALTEMAARRVVALAGEAYTPVGEVVDERAVVNAIVALHATGGSTNHTIHLVAIARAAGLRVDWDDFAALARVTPLLARVYPNGAADVNAFHRAGGVGSVVRELLGAGLMHADARTIAGDLRAYASTAGEPDPTVVRPVTAPFSPDGGLSVLDGPLGRAVMKVSSLDPARLPVDAPAAVFDSQDAFVAAYRAGELDRDVVVVVRFQGPRANGMPELHQLTPALGDLQRRGRRVALVTDGRMSGASGRVPAAIHLTPEAAAGGPLARVRDGDRIVVGVDRLEWSAAGEQREPAQVRLDATGYGREWFAPFRGRVTSAEQGALSIGED
ncbi:MAG: phosphogluconate dehydratase, partial [Myxococcota bacterium]